MKFDISFPGLHPLERMVTILKPYCFQITGLVGLILALFGVRSIFGWVGALLVLASLAGAMLSPWSDPQREWFLAHYGWEKKDRQMEDMLALSHDLAEVDVPALAGALTALTLGDLTHRLEAHSTPIEARGVGSAAQLAAQLNRIREQLDECAHSYNWVTDQPCDRLFYIGSDSYQEGRRAAEILADRLGGHGAVMVALISNSSDFLVLRVRGFMSLLAEKYPDIHLAQIVEHHYDSTLKDILACFTEHPDIRGVYGADTSAPHYLAKALTQLGRSNRVAVVGQDVNEKTAQLLQSRSLAASISQDPYAQGYNLAVGLFNAVVGGWRPESARMLTECDVVTAENLGEFWKIGDGLVVSGTTRARLMKPIEQRAGNLVKIAIIGMPPAFYKFIQQGAGAAAQELRRLNAQVDWLMPAGARSEDGVHMTAEVYAPFIQDLAQQGYQAIGVCILDPGLIPTINALAARGIIFASYNAEPTSLRWLMSTLVERGRTLEGASQELLADAENSSKVNAQINENIHQISASATSEAETVNQATASIMTINEGIGQIAEGAGRQSQAAGEVAQASDRISQAIELTSQAVQSVNQVSGESVQTAREGAAAVQQTLQQMHSIQEAVDASAASIRRLNEDSNQIGEIVETIRDIAEQTNLLALNAAIEAARAGEHGLGFAVVAGEVRNLAEKSAESTKKIAALIRNTQTNVAETVSSMQKATENVHQGSLVAEGSARALDALLNSSTEVQKRAETTGQANAELVQVLQDLHTAIAQVSAVIEENQQATGQIAGQTDQAMGLIENLASISQENAASTEAVSAASDEVGSRVKSIEEKARGVKRTALELMNDTIHFKLAD